MFHEELLCVLPVYNAAEPCRQGFVPDKGVPAKNHGVVFCKTQHPIAGVKVESLGCGPQGFPLQFHLGY